MSAPVALGVTILISSLGLVRGGLETLAAHFAAGLAERGHRVSLVSGYWPGYPLPEDLAALPVHCLRVPCIPAQLAVWRYFAKDRPGRPLKFQALSFAYACRWLPRARQLVAAADVTLTFHEVETTLLSNWRAQRHQPHVSYFPGLIDQAWLRSDRSTVRVAISHTIADRHRQLPWFTADGVVTPGIPDQLLTLPYEVRHQVSTLIFVGRLESNKGVMELLIIFKALAAESFQLRLRILGDGPLRSELQRLIDADSLTDRVALLGAVPAERVYRELQSSDLFVFPSRYESFGISLLEAQAIGVPVVCSDIPGIREAVGNAGRLLPLDDVECWINALRALIEDRTAREQLSMAGRAHARNFTWGRATQHLEEYLYLAQARPG